MKMNKFRKLFFGKMHKDFVYTIETLLFLAIIIGLIGLAFFQLFINEKLEPFWYSFFIGNSIVLFGLSFFLYLLGKVLAVIFPPKVKWR